MSAERTRVRSSKERDLAGCLIFAVRYALGRRTYAPELVRRVLVNYQHVQDPLQLLDAPGVRVVEEAVERVTGVDFRPVWAIIERRAVATVPLP